MYYDKHTSFRYCSFVQITLATSFPQHNFAAGGQCIHQRSIAIISLPPCDLYFPPPWVAWWLTWWRPPNLCPKWILKGATHQDSTRQDLHKTNSKHTTMHNVVHITQNASEVKSLAISCHQFTKNNSYLASQPSLHSRDKIPASHSSTFSSS